MIMSKQEPEKPPVVKNRKNTKPNEKDPSQKPDKDAEYDNMGRPNSPI